MDLIKINSILQVKVGSYTSCCNSWSSYVCTESVTGQDCSKSDARLPFVSEDPRYRNKQGKIGQSRKGSGRNTESFDPSSTLVRPDMRIIIGSRDAEVFDKGPLRHDDVVVVPEFFCKEEDWSIYYQLIEEMVAAQRKGVKRAEWIRQAAYFPVNRTVISYASDSHVL